MILSISRRTDIPAFYSEWLINRFREGYVYVRNPFNANQISDISLSPEIVDCIVFWSKNPRPLISYLPEVEKLYGNAFYFQYTINGYDIDVEPSVPPLSERLGTLVELSNRYGKNRVIWRYDPIFISEKYTLEWHKEKFKTIFNQIKDKIETCVISFIDLYDKTKSNTKGSGIRALTQSEMTEIAEAFSEIVNGSRVAIKTCAEEIDLEKYGIKKNCCIDKELIERITGFTMKSGLDKQRPFCQCIECADIGIYNTCAHGCKYCYANFNGKRVKDSINAHNTKSPILVGDVTEACVIKPYSKAVSLRIMRNDAEQIEMKF